MYLTAEAVIDGPAQVELDGVKGLEVEDIGLRFLGDELVSEAVHGKDFHTEESTN